MIPALATYDFLFLGPADGVVVVPKQLDLRVVGITSGQAKKYPPAVHWRHLYKAFCQQYRRFIGAPRKQLGVAHFPHLFFGNRGEFFVPIPQGSTPEPGHAFEILFAFVIPQVHAVSSLVHRRTMLLMQL